MGPKKINVLVYSGNGSTVESVRHCVYSLRRLLSPKYVVIPVSSEAIIKEPWTASCALLVMPGGADLGYCRILNGEGNRRISQFVEQGGAYLGLCAGGYYGSKRCEFEVGDKIMEVIGSRELAFYPGTCRGCAFRGFVYHSERGARAVALTVHKSILAKGSVPGTFRSYYNGGGVFVDAPKYKDQGIEVIASYADTLSVESGEDTAAVVYCKVGGGAAILMGPHPEFAAINLSLQEDVPDFSKVIDAVTEDDKLRMSFLRACLAKLTLEVNLEQNAVPSLSRLHITSMQCSDASKLLEGLREIIVVEDGEEYIKDQNDTFHIERPATWTLNSLKRALPGSSDEKTDENDGAEDRILDYSSVVKQVVIHQKEHPTSKETPYFNHSAYYANVKHYQSLTKDFIPDFGPNLMYGEVVTSTNTLLEKNTEVLRRLPTGFTATATAQVAGRGRGSNVWVSPAGSLMFSTVVRHEMERTKTAPVVFLQYLAAIAVVEGINSYGPGYQNLPIKLKWPNDIYARDPSKPTSPPTYIKIGGILVNSHYSQTEYLCVVGTGLNTTNALPTTSLSALLPPNLAAFAHEKLLARLVTCFSALYSRFRVTGFDAYFEEMYYKHWLHTDQVVALETEGGIRAKIKGITKDWGLLVAEELGWQDRPTGRMVQLQSDSNSFDFFKGLLKRKV